ncbi:MAG: NAD(P)/FAD-dependent oxidoreductase [Halioglobus sp.]
MNTTILETDYLVVGSGAVGMAFADVLLAETDANIMIVDRYQKPGGHWNVAYPFVTLHQPSSFYGVSSKELSKGRKDEIGLNKGLGELASGAEVFAYFDEVMRHQFLPSGRVQYFPMCDYQGDRKFVSKTCGKQYEVKVNKKIIDATFLKTSVPSTHTPNFSIADGVRFIPLNDLTKVTTPPEGYTVIGGGKTGIDACLWLLEHNVDPDKIRWIMPRDAWLLDRKNTQATEEFFADSVGANALQMEAIVAAESIPDLFDRLEADGVLLRIDQNVRPKMFHGATISQLELTELRRIKNIVRLGRVLKLESDQIVFEQGTLPTSPNELHVDCSARAISNEEVKPIFEGDLITPQMVRSYQPVFSAAFIAHVEAAYGDDEEKNNLCGVVPLPNHDTDWIRMFSAFMMNQYNWSQDPELGKWLLNNRLDGFSKMMQSVSEDDEEKQAIIGRIRASAIPAVVKLQEFITQI